MSIQGFQFEDSDVIHKYDYESLENKPEFDTTLTQTGKIPDAKKVGDEISNLKEDFNSAFEYEYSKNRFNGEVTAGGIIQNTTGEVVELSSHSYSDWIDISNHGSDNVVFSNATSTSASYTNLRYAFYDANETFVSGGIAPTKQNDATLHRDYAVITTPANAVYMRFSVPTSWFNLTDKVQIEYGQVSAYSAYTGDIPTLKDTSLPIDLMDDVGSMIADATAEFTEFVNSDKERFTQDTEIQLTWIDGEYYNLTTGAVATASGYSRTAKAECKAGDIIRIINNKGQILWFDNNDNLLLNESTSYNSSIYRVAPTNAAKYAFNNQDATVRATACHKTNTATDIISHTFKAPARLICGSDRFESGQYVSTTNGRYYSGSAYSTYFCLPVWEVEPSHKYRTQTQAQIVFYTDTMQYISAIDNVINGSQYTGLPIEMDFETPSTCKFIAINSKSAHEQLYDIESYTILGNIENLPKLHGKTVVCFGDSITGNYGFGDNYPYQIEEKTGAKTYNCGFGGCRMELLHNETTVHTNPFSMCGIVDALESGDWTDQDQYAMGVSSRVYFRLQILKSIDFSKVDIVTIAYGTNEGGYPQDDPEDPYNKYTYAGATRYAINKLLTLYPKLRIVLLTPIFRWYTDTNESSDTKVNPTYGGKLTDNVATLISVGRELKMPVIDLYYTLGINADNRTSYFGDDDEQSDGTHINSYGREQMGRRIAGELNRLF